MNARHVPAAFAVALGYGIVGQIFFALAALGVFTRVAVIIVLMIVLLIAVMRVRTWSSPIILIAALPSFILALYPPVGFDATAYHLPYAKLFANAGMLVFADTLRFPVFPQLGEMHFAAALLLANDNVAQLTQWLALVVTAAGAATIAAELGRPSPGATRHPLPATRGEGQRGRVALLPACGEKVVLSAAKGRMRGGDATPTLAAALWLGNPIAIYLGANAYIDCTLAMCVTLAFGAWMIWRRTEEPMWIALTGAFAGMAAATKYHGLFFLLVFFVAATWRRLSAGILYAIPAALFAVPWYARIAHDTGNPVFPFLGRIFGRSDWQPFVEREPGAFFGIPTDPMLSILRRAYLDPLARGMPPYSPWLALLLPLAIAAAVIERRLRFPLAISALWLVLMSPFDWRFMLPVIPLLCAAIALILGRLLSQRALAAAIVALALPGFAWGTILIAKYGPLPRSRDAFLASKIPVYRALQFSGENTVYLFDASNAAYYCRGRCLGEHLGPYRYELIAPLLGDPPQLAARLRAFGVRYLVMKTSRHVKLPFRRVYADDAAEVFDITSAP